MRAYTYTYTCAHGSHLYSVYYPRDVVIRGWKIFRGFPMIGRLIGWLVRGWRQIYGVMCDVLCGCYLSLCISIYGTNVHIYIYIYLSL